MKPSTSILEEALQVTSGARQRYYGTALQNHQRIALMWNSYIEAKHGIRGLLSPSDVAWLMVQLKIARNIHRPKRDNLVDVAGYARCISSIEGFEP
jgi:hypothetical protein